MQEIEEHADDMQALRAMRRARALAAELGEPWLVVALFDRINELADHRVLLRGARDDCRHDAGALH